VAESCIEAVDSCCVDDACGGVIADLESCSTQRTQSCATLTNADDADGAHRNLSTCVAKSCAEACGSPGAANVTECQGAYVTSVEACTCELGSKPNSTPCTEAGHPKLRCCAPAAWPGPALSCECLTIICVSISDGCMCQLTAMDDSGRAAECSGTHCCFDPNANQCKCGSRECLLGETAVDSCTVEQLGCPQGRHHVDTCSIPKP
jgi:hypothetical protein